MRYLKMTEKQKAVAVKMHRKCWHIDKRRLKRKKGAVEVVKGEMIYRA